MSPLPAPTSKTGKGIAYRCTVGRCRKPRAVLEVGGRRKRAKQCRDHLPPRLRVLLLEQEAKDAPSAEDNRCGAHSRKGRPCRRPAGWGTEHIGYGACRLHGGNMRNHLKKAAKEQAMEAAIVMGMPIDTDPLEALLTCVRIAAGEVSYCSHEVARLEREEAVVEDRTVETTESDEFGNSTKVTESTSVELNIWISARHHALDRLAKFSKMALDAGVAERQVKLAESYGEQIARMIDTVLTGLKLTAAQRQRAPEVVRSAMAVIEGTATEVTG